MPATVVSITIPETQLARVVKCLCRRGGRPETAANAKAQLVAELTRWVEQEQREEAPTTAPELS
jgi:hypothetical protein